MLRTRYGLIGAVGALIVVLAGADMLVESNPAFGIDGAPAFAAWYGIVAGTAAIVTAFGWGRLMRRRETSAEEEGGDA